MILQGEGRGGSFSFLVERGLYLQVNRFPRISTDSSELYIVEEVVTTFQVEYKFNVSSQ